MTISPLFIKIAYLLKNDTQSSMTGIKLNQKDSKFQNSDKLRNYWNYLNEPYEINCNLQPVG